MANPMLKFLTAVILTASFTLPAGSAQAQTPINWAEIVKIIKNVSFRPDRADSRPARLADRLQQSGDKVSTGRSSMADLRLSEGSVIRMRSNANVTFKPGTRKICQGSGTALYLIKPAQGRTELCLPGGIKAGIRGSALFVRIVPQTNTAIIGALTDSGIEISPADGQPGQVLKAGQMAVVAEGKISMFDFDLRSFYQTSDLVKGFDLTGQLGTSSDPAVAAVQAETIAAVSQQVPLTGSDVVVNPSFLNPSTGAAIAVPTNPLNLSTAANAPALGVDSPSVAADIGERRQQAELPLPVQSGKTAASVSQPDKLTALPAVTTPIVTTPIVTTPIVTTPIVTTPVVVPATTTATPPTIAPPTTAPPTTAPLTTATTPVVVPITSNPNPTVQTSPNGVPTGIQQPLNTSPVRPTGSANVLPPPTINNNPPATPINNNPPTATNNNNPPAATQINNQPISPPISNPTAPVSQPTQPPSVSPNPTLTPINNPSPTTPTTVTTTPPGVPTALIPPVPPRVAMPPVVAPPVVAPPVVAPPVVAPPVVAPPVVQMPLVVAPPIVMPPIAIPPVAPTPPVASTAPTMPFGPTAPTAPMMPFGPTAPVAPTAPTAPMMPFGPTAPVAPTAPIAPTAPTAPTALVTPATLLPSNNPVAASTSTPVTPAPVITPITTTP